MILLDPDLDQATAPRSSAETAHDLRIPARRSLAQFLSRARKVVRIRGQVSVLLTTDEAQRSLNRRFRRKNKPTDVLSFPADHAAAGAAKIAGDLSISVPTAQRQAVQHGHSLSTEIKVLMLHGLLHLAGYDHEVESGEMARLERRLRTQLRLPGGLIERTSSAKRRRG